MIPNDFGIIRQPDHNLFACLFPPRKDISEYDFEIVMPEYVDGAYYTTTGSPISNAQYSYGVVDCSKYDFVLIPISTYGPNCNSGFRVDPTTGSMLQNLMSGHIRIQNVDNVISGYALMYVESGAPYACISTYKEYKLPLIGFIRKRSDGANPKGIIDPIPKPAPDLKKEAPEEEDLEEKE